jgi:hypothetical protein
MVASEDTIKKLLVVLRRHIDDAKLQEILAELQHTPGNASFKNTLLKLMAEYEKQTRL